MKITRIETIHLADYAQILFVAIHTDEGITGYSDTFYMTEAVRGYIRHFAAPMLLVHDPLQIELHWKRLYEVIAHIAGKGAEIRGLSAIDCALWDIFGQATGQPVYQLLGGAVRESIKTYNTCGGPRYGRPTRPLDYRRVAQAIFTEPEIASVGLDEADAAAEGRRIRSTKVPFASNSRSVIQDATRGFVKLISDPATHEVLGGTIVGYRAADLIGIIALAVQARVHVEDVVDTIMVHPSLSESIAQAAD